MNEITTFSTPELGMVRTTIIDGEPYFVGKDVADILGYKNSSDALSRKVDAEDKGVAKCDTLGGTQEMTVINESGLYSLILSSKMPHAKRFKRWITSEVIPSIRKNGMYATPKTVEDILKDPDSFITILKELKAERERSGELELEVAATKQQLAEAQPKASYYDIVLDCKDTIPISVIAKDYGWTAIQMNQYLHKKGIQYKQGDTWLLYRKHAAEGYTDTKTHLYRDNAGIEHTRVHTYWRQKGRLFIYETLKNDGILPIIESEV